MSNEICTRISIYIAAIHVPVPCRSSISQVKSMSLAPRECLHNVLLWCTILSAFISTRTGKFSCHGGKGLNKDHISRFFLKISSKRESERGIIISVTIYSIVQVGDFFTTADVIFFPFVFITIITVLKCPFWLIAMDGHNVIH